MKEQLEKINRELREVVTYMTVRGEPFNPPMVGEALERQKKFRPESYKKLMRYLELEEQRKTLEKKMEG